MFKMMANKNATLKLVAILAVFAIALPQTEAARKPAGPMNFIRNQISRVISPRYEPVYMGRPVSSAASAAAAGSGGGTSSSAAASFSGGPSHRYVPASYSPPVQYSGVNGGYMPRYAKPVPQYAPSYDQGYVPTYVEPAPVAMRMQAPAPVPRAYPQNTYAATETYGNPDRSSNSYRKIKDDHIKHVSGHNSGNRYQETGAFAKTLDEHENENYHKNKENVVSTPNLYQSNKSTVTWSKNRSKNAAKSGSHSINKDKFKSGFVHDERDLHERIDKRRNKDGVVSSSNVARNVNHHNEGRYDSAGLYPPAPQYVPAPAPMPVQQHYAPPPSQPEEYYDDDDDDDEVGEHSASAAAAASGEHSAASAAAASGEHSAASAAAAN